MNNKRNISDDTWEEFIARWIAENESEKPVPEDGDHDSAEGSLIILRLEGDHEALWQFVIRTFERNMSEFAFGMLAAGALEDIISKFGETYIDRIEEMARSNPRFNELLGGVWNNSATDEVWSRVEKVRLKVW